MQLIFVFLICSSFKLIQSKNLKGKNKLDMELIMDKHFCKPEVLKYAISYYCDGNGKVFCKSGWKHDEDYNLKNIIDQVNPCPVPICDWNGKGCDHGVCKAPQFCACDIGWEGTRCEKCIYLTGCEMGTCENPFECNCNKGWTGEFCNQALCENCTNGQCIKPGQCSCDPGWFGPNCSNCTKMPGCKHGNCGNHPFTCVCHPGWSGSLCDIPECSPPCDPNHGVCIEPNQCLCHKGWKNATCGDCVPYWECPYQGKDACQNPNECYCPEKTPDPHQLCRPLPGPTPAVMNVTVTPSTTPPTTTATTTPLTTTTATVTTTPLTCSNFSHFNTSTGTCVCDTGYTGPKCQRDGGYGEWTRFSPCTANCEGQIGEQVRRRYCVNPTPSNGGLNCTEQPNLGPNRESRPCEGTIKLQSDDPDKVCFTINE